MDPFCGSLKRIKKHKKMSKKLLYLPYCRGKPQSLFMGNLPTVVQKTKARHEITGFAKPSEESQETPLNASARLAYKKETCRISDGK